MSHHVDICTRLPFFKHTGVLSCASVALGDSSMKIAYLRRLDVCDAVSTRRPHFESTLCLRTLHTKGKLHCISSPLEKLVPSGAQLQGIAC